MELAGYHVFWAFSGGSSLFVGLCVWWLVQPEPLAKVFKKLILSDFIFLWMAFAAIFHSFLYLVPVAPSDSESLIVLWVVSGLYLLFRLWGRVTEAVLMGMMVLLWGFSLYGGQVFVEELEKDHLVVKESLNAETTSSKVKIRITGRGYYLTRMPAPSRALAVKIHIDLNAHRPLPPSARALFKLELPRILDHAYSQDNQKLKTYQWLQGFLLVVVLLLWGFAPHQKNT